MAPSDATRRIAALSLSEASRLVAARELSSVELTRACLEMCAAVEPQVSAFSAVDEEGALAAARTLDRELVRDGPRSALHGIPLAVKDLIDVAGLPTSAGSSVLDDRPPARADAEVVRRLREAGAVMLGKTTTHEFAYGVVTPQTRNPWDTEHVAGGSSGGSAVAVATGECFGALGTDTAGSIRIPAALCGVTGLKPRGRSLPMAGIVPLSPLLDSCGPLARTAADAELMWDALRPTAAAPRGGGALRLVRAGEDVLGELDSDVLAAYEAAVDLLAADGATIVDADLPAFSDWDPARAVPLLRDMLLVHRDAGWHPAAGDRYGPELRRALAAAELLDADQIVRALRRIGGLAARLVACLDHADALLTPATPVPAPARSELEVDDEGPRPPVVRLLTRFSAPVNWCPLAAVSVPCGVSSAGLPVGLQVIAGTERAALDVARRLQALSDHHRRRPPLAAVGER